ncbi:MAG: YlmC/YmxH family sporulation protein [Clostridia bacterium]|nr:YlmC/YmxH family sporulation protein [Clostridia bacterium]
MNKTSDFRQKEVINIYDGKRLGYVCDVDIDITTGKLNAIIIPGGAKFLGLFGTADDYVIPWNNIKTVGEDIILVDYILPSETSSLRRA